MRKKNDAVCVSADRDTDEYRSVCTNMVSRRKNVSQNENQSILENELKGKFIIKNGIEKSECNGFSDCKKCENSRVSL